MRSLSWQRFADQFILPLGLAAGERAAKDVAASAQKSNLALVPARPERRCRQTAPAPLLRCTLR